jgi:tRNA pseudouridine38-40 synthase
MPQRYKLTIEYNGAYFCGWQRQTRFPSVQETIEEAIYSFSQEKTIVFGAGRTDAGVHALGQVAHFDLVAKKPSPHTVCGALNHYLKGLGIVILGAELVDAGFHARFSATQRSYVYYILNRPVPSALMDGKVWHVKRQLDVEKMHSAGQYLVGYHDFSSFRSIHCQAKSAIRTIDYLAVTQEGEMVILNIASRSFLHNQVRIIVGNLVEIGRGRHSITYMKELLEARDRKKAFMTAPSMGLYLKEVKYPSQMI